MRVVERERWLGWATWSGSGVIWYGRGEGGREEGDIVLGVVMTSFTKMSSRENTVQGWQIYG